jgi:hypothetical protein
VQRNGVASIGIIARRSSLEPQDLAAARTGAVRREHRTSASEQIMPARGRQQLADQRPLCQWRDTTHLCRSSSRLANGGSASARSQGRTQAEDDPRKTPVGTGRHGTERDSCPRFCATGWASVVVRVLSSTASAVCYPWCAVALAPEARQCPAFATWSGGSWPGVWGRKSQPAGHCRVRVCPRRSTRMVPGSYGGRSSGAHHAGCVIRARLLARSGTTLPRRRRLRRLARRAHRPVRDVRR